jgi:hypothetical protein
LAIKRDNTKDMCNYCKKLGHWAQDYKKKTFDLQLKEQAKETIYVAKQTFSTTTIFLVNETWYIDLRASQHLMFQKKHFL